MRLVIRYRLILWKRLIMYFIRVFDRFQNCLLNVMQTITAMAKTKVRIDRGSFSKILEAKMVRKG